MSSPPPNMLALPKYALLSGDYGSGSSRHLENTTLMMTGKFKMLNEYGSEQVVNRIIYSTQNTNS